MEVIPVPDSLGEEAILIDIFTGRGYLKGQGVLISATPSLGNKTTWESAIAQMGERQSSVLLSELHTNWVRVRASPASMYFHTGWCINLA